MLANGRWLTVITAARLIRSYTFATTTERHASVSRNVLSVQAGDTYRHRNPEKRRAYMRAYMALKRAKIKE
jgi:hypothetical protein